MATSDTSVDPFSSLAGRRVRPNARPSVVTRLKPTPRDELIKALKGTACGERAAFEKVYAATAVKLYGVIVRILGRRDLAEDVLQEVYIRVWQHASEFDPAISSPITWLATIARNRALDEAKRKTITSLDDCSEVLQLARDDDPRVDYERNEEQRRLLVCVDRLEPKKRQLVLLAYYYGMTRDEIARATGRPVATVKTWLRRSLAQLKGCLRP